MIKSIVELLKKDRASSPAGSLF